MFQHNKNVCVDIDSYAYVKSYKSQLLMNLGQLFSDIGVRYVISHGNLLEYERGEPIHHDDDIDLRVCRKDIEKWAMYCNEPCNMKNPKYNIKFDKRFMDMDRQIQNGVQCWLIQFKDSEGICIKTFEKMNIHADVVLDSVTSNFWMDYDIDWDSIEEVTFLNIKTYVPNKKDRERVLTANYGVKYIIPKRKIKYLF